MTELTSTRKILFKTKTEKAKFIRDCKKVTGISRRYQNFESIVYDFIVDIVRLFDTRDTEIFKEIYVISDNDSWLVEWQLSVKVYFDFEKYTITVISTIDEEFERKFIFNKVFGEFIEKN